MDGEVLANGVLQLHGAAMRAALDLTLAEGGEPALDLVEPRTGGGREMDVEARTPRQPGPHGWGLVGAVVVHHQMHVQGGGNAGLDGAQKLEELLAAVPAMQLADHLAAGAIEGGEACGGAVTTVSMGGARGQGRGQS